jgi:hypothetical protein
VTCGELFRQFLEVLDEGDMDFRLFRRLFVGCRRWALKAVDFVMLRAWAYCRDPAVDPAHAYWRMVSLFWDLVNWHGLPCRALAELAARVAKAAARYSWPLKWPFLVMAAVAAEKNGCGLPEAAAEALGPEYEALTAFLERGEAAVEVAGRKTAIIRKRRSIVVANLDS